MNTKKMVFALLCVLGAALFVRGEQASPAARNTEKRTIALIVQNHCAPDANIPMVALTDALSAQLSGRGFQVVNPYNVIGENMNRTVAGEALPASSAVELARKVGADGVVTAAVMEFLDTPLGTPPIVHTFSIRLSFNLADAGTGAVVCGDMLKAKSPQYTVKQVQNGRQEYLGDLIYSAAGDCASRLERKAAAWRPVVRPKPKAGEAKTSPVTEFPSAHKPLQDSVLRMSDVDDAVACLVASMRGDSRFKENYEAAVGAIAENSSARLPIAVIGGLENKTGDAAMTNLLSAANESVRVMLFNTALFDVKDDQVVVDLSKRIVASGNSPLENGELMSALKQHGSPDFFVVGDLRQFAEIGNRRTYRVRLAMHSLSTGKVVWEGIRTIMK